METKIDKSIEILRELQTLLFDDAIESKELFQVTLRLQDTLDEASVEYNQFLKEKNNK